MSWLERRLKWRNGWRCELFGHDWLGIHGTVCRRPQCTWSKP